MKLVGRLLVVLVIVSVVVGLAWLRLGPALDAQLEGMETWRPPTTCRVLDRHGDVIDEFALVRRTWVPIDTLPDMVWQAVVSAEDRRFFEHNGVDLAGILRAALVNLQAGAIREGGSTLTQQVVKNAIVGGERSYRRKLEEALLAWRLEQRLDKRTILELYLNFVYFGSGNYGVEAAAKDYFGIPASELDAGQSALLAGLIPAPSRYSPRRDEEAAARRRSLVLDGMARDGFLEPDEADAAKMGPIDPPYRLRGLASEGASYLTSIRREVRRLLGSELPHQAGLRIHTPHDVDVQAAAEVALDLAAQAVEKRQGHFGPIDSIPWTAVALTAFLEAGEGLTKDEHGVFQPPRDGACLPAVLTSATRAQLKAGPFRWTLEPRSAWRRLRTADPEVPAEPLVTSGRRGQVFEICTVDATTARLDERPWVEGAAVVLENDTGRVVALVGGRQMELEGFNRATQARRQPGSSFKPYVYAAALENGRTQIDSVLDAPLSFGSGRGRWAPRNSNGRYLGPVPMRRALALSINTVAVRLGMEVGPAGIRDMARRAGVRARLRDDLTLSLGSSEVSVMDQAVGFSTFARMGRAGGAVFIDRLVDVRGHEVGRAGGPVVVDGQEMAQLPGTSTEQVIPPWVAWQVVEMLQGVVQTGTGYRAKKDGEQRGGKTGTSSASVDAWFVGLTPTHTVAVWMGVDDRSSLGRGESGGRAALPAWVDIVAALPSTQGQRFPIPDDVVQVPWHGEWIGVPAHNVPPAVLSVQHPGLAPLADFPGNDGNCESLASP